MKTNLIASKSMSFAVRIVKFYQYLCSVKKEYVLSKQLLRSGTSIGANVRESRNAQSTADFISKQSIALKEADESLYWLELLLLSDVITQDEYQSMYKDANELVALLTTSIKKLKGKL